MPGGYTHQTRATGTVLTANIYNTDHQNHITFQTPLATEDYSADVTQMRLTTSPGTVGAESLATSLAGDIERLRHVIKTMHGGAQWYPGIALTGGSFVGPSTDNAAARFDGIVGVLQNSVVTISDTGDVAGIGALTMSGALTYGGVALAAAVTGTGNMVLSAAPTFTGTINAAALTLASTLTLSGTVANIELGANFISRAGTDAGLSLDASNNATLSGNLTVATITSSNQIRSGLANNTGITPFLYASGSEGTGRHLMVVEASNNGNKAVIQGFKTRAASTNAPTTAITSGDNLVYVSGFGADGTNYIEGVRLEIGTEGTIATNRVPGRFRIFTHPDSTSGLAVAATFDSSQNTTLAGNLTVSGGTITTGSATALSLATTAGTFLQGINVTSSDRYLTVTPGVSGSGTNATIGVSGGSLAITPNVVMAGTLTTSAPTGGAGAWELGIANAVSPTAPDRTITIEIGGTAYYIHAKTTND